MKNLKKQVTLFLAVIMLSSLLFGCQSAESAEKKTSSPASTSAADAATANQGDVFKDHQDISIAFWDIDKSIPEGGNDAVRDMIYKKFNITIKPVNITWDDYTEKILTWAASDQLPDVFAADCVNTINFEKWITQGVVHKLPDNLAQYPNLTKYLDQPDVQNYKYPFASKEGKYYCIPRPTYPNVDMWAGDVGITIRKDWMNNVGITKEPENMDEFIELMKAFAEKDPDKNNKNDTIGLTCYSGGWLTYLMLGYEPGVVSGNWWIKDKDGKWIPPFMTENCLEGVKAFKKLYDSNGLDKDFATIKGEEGLEKFITGRAGAYAHQVCPGYQQDIYDKMMKINPKLNWDEQILLLHPFKHKDGNYYRLTAPTPWSETYINAKCDDKKVDRILSFYDYFFSDEGFNLIQLGIEGTDWKKDGDNIVITREKTQEGNFIPIEQKYPICGINGLSGLFSWAKDWDYKNPQYNPAILKKSNDLLDWNLKNSKPIPTDLRLSFIKYPSKDKDTASFTDDLIKAIMSKDVDKAWNEIVNSYRTNGYDKVIEELNKKAEEYGIK